MTKRVKTTVIEKKTKTGQTIKLDFAKVVDRLNEFRENNPRGLVQTEPTVDNENKVIIFKTRIVRDKKDPNSAEATGHAMGKIDGSEKQFEKLETISVGRALALLGYAASGEVASYEEMQEFYEYRDNKIDEAVSKLEGCQTIDELRDCFMSLDSLMAEEKIIEAKDKRKAELQKGAKDENSKS